MRIVPPMLSAARLLRLEIHRHAIDAVAQMGRRRPVLENMAEMAAATAAMHLGANHAVARICRGLHCSGLRIVEARPTSAALELGFGDEQLLLAAGAIERAGALFVIECAAPRPFGALLAHDVVLLRSEDFAPFRFGMGDRIFLGVQDGAHEVVLALDTHKRNRCTVMRNPIQTGHSDVELEAVAGKLGVMFVGATLPTPLYPLYRENFGFSAVTLTLIYATYVLGNLAALLFFGTLSDQIGRRATSLPAIAVGIASTAVFAAAQGTPWLFAARGLSGFSTGLAFRCGDSLDRGALCHRPERRRRAYCFCSEYSRLRRRGPHWRVVRAIRAGAAAVVLFRLSGSFVRGGRRDPGAARDDCGAETLCRSQPAAAYRRAARHPAAIRVAGRDRLCHVFFDRLLFGADPESSWREPASTLAAPCRRDRVRAVSRRCGGHPHKRPLRQPDRHAGRSAAVAAERVDPGRSGACSFTHDPGVRRGFGRISRRAWLSRQPRSDQPHRARRSAQRSGVELYDRAVCR